LATEGNNHKNGAKKKYRFSHFIRLSPSKISKNGEYLNDSQTNAMIKRGTFVALCVNWIKKTEAMIQRGKCRPALLYLMLGILFCSKAAFPQIPIPDPGPVFRDDILPRISLFLPKDSLDKIYQNPESDQEMRTLFVFESGSIRDTLPVVGIRIRGNTSRQSGKKSIKISFNTYNSRQSFFGLEKMNLNGEHNDPSIIRSKLYWDLARSFRVPAPRSNHILLYINDIFWGVFINVEQIDEEFAEMRFGNKKGNLYKCLYPADLTYRSDNPNDYKFMSGSRRTYELKTNETEDNYSDLAHFIDILNNTPMTMLPAELDKVINVGTLLKILVLDVFTGNWDGPFYNKKIPLYIIDRYKSFWCASFSAMS